MGIARLLVKLTTSRNYNLMRIGSTRVQKRKLIAEREKNLMLRFNNSVKSLLTRSRTCLRFNIRYFGPDTTCQGLSGCSRTSWIWGPVYTSRP